MGHRFINLGQTAIMSYHHYLEILYFLLKTKQLNELSADFWLKSANLDLRDLQNHQSKISAFQLAKLIHTAIKYYPNQNLGLEFGQLGQLIASSHTMEEVFTYMAKFSLLNSPLVKLKLLKTDSHYVFKIKLLVPFTPHKQFIITSAFACLHQVRRSLLEQTSPACELYLDFTPADITSYYQYYGQSLHFNQTTCEYRIPILEGAIPIKSHHAIVQEIAKTSCEKQLKRITKNTESYHAEVKRLLLDDLLKYCKLEATASVFFTSERTLKRRLKAENTTFQDILNEARKELAVEYLHDKTLSLQDVAANLGYSDMPNFTRAFKRWFGVPPSKFHRG